MFLHLLKISSSLSFLCCLRTLLPPFPPLTRREKQERRRERNQGNSVNLLLLVYALWNKHDKVSNTQRHTSWWWNSSAAGTNEEPLCCNHRSPQDLLLGSAHSTLSALSPNRDLLEFSSLPGGSCHYLGTSHFQLKHSYYWQFLPISAYARLTFLLFSCLSHHVYLLIILIYTVHVTDTFFIGMFHL